MSKKFNPPPNWPPAPAGWTPPEGWRPDPSWGPAPVGWNFWVDDVDVDATLLPSASSPSDTAEPSAGDDSFGEPRKPAHRDPEAGNGSPSRSMARGAGKEDRLFSEAASTGSAASYETSSGLPRRSSRRRAEAGRGPAASPGFGAQQPRDSVWNAGGDGADRGVEGERQRPRFASAGSAPSAGGFAPAASVPGDGTGRQTPFAQESPFTRDPSFTQNSSFSSESPFTQETSYRRQASVDGGQPFAAGPAGRANVHSGQSAFSTPSAYSAPSSGFPGKEQPPASPFAPQAGSGSPGNNPPSAPSSPSSQSSYQPTERYDFGAHPGFPRYGDPGSQAPSPQSSPNQSLPEQAGFGQPSPGSQLQDNQAFGQAMPSQAMPGSGFDFSSGQGFDQPTYGAASDFGTGQPFGLDEPPRKSFFTSGAGMATIGVLAVIAIVAAIFIPKALNGDDPHNDGKETPTATSTTSWSSPSTTPSTPKSTVTPAKPTRPPLSGNFSEYKGNNEQMIDIQKPVAGKPALVYYEADTNQSRNLFTVKTLDSNGNESGSNFGGLAAKEKLSGTHPIDLFDDAKETAKFNVSASGAWTIRIYPIDSIPTVSKGTTIAGNSAEAFIYRGPQTQAKIKYVSTVPYGKSNEKKILGKIWPIDKSNVQGKTFIEDSKTSVEQEFTIPATSQESLVIVRAIGGNWSLEIP